MRRHGADDKVGGCYPDGNKHNGENESLCPPIFAWVRRGMNYLRIIIAKTVPDKEPIRAHQQINTSILMRANIKPGQHMHMHKHTHTHT